MRNSICILLVLCGMLLCGIRGHGQDIRLWVAASSDVHGAIFPYDLGTGRSLPYSLAHLSTFLKQLRSKAGENLVLLDNGDLIQGDPASYHANFVAAEDTHLFVRAMNYLGYDAATVGNHDIEAGHAVYDRFRDQLGIPWMAANAVHTGKDQPWFRPYHIVERQGIRIAILGLVTPSIPEWLPPVLWEGMEFKDMASEASRWMDTIQLRESPDLVIGLFHSGADTSWMKQGFQAPGHENAAAWVAHSVKGFDVIFCGHDHQGWNMKVAGPGGDSVLILGTTSRARDVALAEIVLTKDVQGSLTKQIRGNLVLLSDYPPDADFLSRFSTDIHSIREFVADTLGWLDTTLIAAEAVFGPCPFTDLIHRAQMDLSGADISFTAPLSTRSRLLPGPMTTGMLFDLYRYENYLYVMELQGKEIDGFLEHAVKGWFSMMRIPEDALLDYEREPDGRIRVRYGQPQTKGIFYHFSSAAGLRYTLDLCGPPGDRVQILGMSNGQDFHADSVYRVAVNSYRGSGGGGHLTMGAGIARDSLASRVIWTSDHDLRYHLMDWFRQHSPVQHKKVTEWGLVPEGWYREAVLRERPLWGLP